MKLYVCTRAGHRFRSDRPFTVALRWSGKVIRTKPICPDCFVSWLEGLFPVEERKEGWEPPHVEEARLEKAIEDAEMADFPRPKKKRKRSP